MSGPLPKKKHKQTDGHLKSARGSEDGLQFEAVAEQALRTPQLGRAQTGHKSARGANPDNSMDLSSSRKDKTKLKAKKSTQSSATSKEQGAGQAKKRIGLLMKESHSIFKLDDKQKQLMHQMKQEDSVQK